MSSKPEKVTVSLSPTDRALLRRIADALVGTAVPEDELAEGGKVVKRLVENESDPDAPYPNLWGQ